MTTYGITELARAAWKTHGAQAMSNKHINNGGSAFPGQWYDLWPPTGEQVVRWQWSGMTLRDYFAAKAMQGYFASPVASHRVDADDVAKYCYAMADAMLKAREASND